MRRSFLAAGLGLLLPVAAIAQVATPPHQNLPQDIDSGYQDNNTGAPMVLYKHTFKVANTAWVQLKFGETTNLPQGTILRMFGTEDKVFQRHNARSLADYDMWSAGFNGQEMVLELVAGPHTSGNRVEVDILVRGLHGTAGVESICGTTDDRVRSSDRRQGRLWLGCTGWLAGIISGGTRNLMLTAGHCASAGARILELNVPLSSSTGTVRRSLPNDQYPYTILNRVSAGVGADWQVTSVGKNSNTNRLPTQANGGVFYNLGTVPSSTSGQNITITGYGTTSPRNSLSQVQKIHTGPLSQIRSTSLCYATDTSGGNSGSPVIHANTGRVIGIHTHGGCSRTGGCNSGTRIDRSDLQAAITAAGKRPGTFVTFGTGCRGSGRASSACVSLNGNGGTLSGTTAPNEYAYTATAARSLRVTGFEVYSRSTTGSNVTVAAAIYAATAAGIPGTRLASGTITIGGTAGFYRATMSATVPAGRFFVAVNHAARTTVLATLASGTAGSGYWRRTGVTWRRSGIIARPSYRVLCAGGGSNNAIPQIGNTGVPMINSSFSIDLSLAKATASCVLMVGASKSRWAGGRLPWDLRPIGAAGCLLLQSADLMVSGLMTSRTGNASLPVRIPNQASLVGARGYCQWYVVDPGNNTANIAVSNGGDATIGG